MGMYLIFPMLFFGVLAACSFAFGWSYMSPKQKQVIAGHRGPADVGIFLINAWIFKTLSVSGLIAAGGIFVSSILTSLGLRHVAKRMPVTRRIYKDRKKIATVGMFETWMPWISTRVVGRPKEEPIRRTAMSEDEFILALAEELDAA